MKNILLILLITSYSLFSQSIDEAKVLKIVEILAKDSLEGRKIGTEGNAKARSLIKKTFLEDGLLPFTGSYEQVFFSGEVKGVNVLGYIPGTSKKSRWIIVSAHYDHLGVIDGEIYNGADDNASGVGAMLGMTKYFVQNPPLHSILFVAFDGEESRLSGAEAFVKEPPVSLNLVELVLNMDMISKSVNNELFIAGTHHYPNLKKYLNTPDSPEFKVRLGHDNEKNKKEQDWTYSSDHGPFHKKKIPFLYFGVEDHDDYHKPTDDFERIDKDFYLNAAKFILKTLQTLDDNL